MCTSWHRLAIGVRFLHHRDLAAAEAVFKGVAEIQPDMAQAWYNLAWIYDAQRRYDEAAAALATALKLDPNWEGAWNTLRQALEILATAPCFS